MRPEMMKMPDGLDIGAGRLSVHDCSTISIEPTVIDDDCSAISTPSQGARRPGQFKPGRAHRFHGTRELHDVFTALRADTQTLRDVVLDHVCVKQPKTSSTIFLEVVNDFGPTNLRRVIRALAYWRGKGTIVQASRPDWSYRKIVA